MQKRTLRSWLTIAAVPAIGLAFMLPATGALGATHGGSGGAVATPSKVMVFLHDNAVGLAPRTAVRANAVRSEEVPVLATLRASGATSLIAGKTLPFIIATLSPADAPYRAAA